jgi:hypothetical protein
MEIERKQLDSILPALEIQAGCVASSLPAAPQPGRGWWLERKSARSADTTTE